MFSHRQHLIEQQILKNRASCQSQRLVSPADLKTIMLKAAEQLKVSKIRNGELDFTKINQFLLLTDPAAKTDFFINLRQSIQLILSDADKCKIFQEKWSSGLRHNVLKLFAALSKEFLKNEPADWKKDLLKMVTVIAEKVLRAEKIWRIEEKLIDSFITESLQNLTQARRMLEPYLDNLGTLAKKFSASSEIPKTLSNIEYIQFGILRILDIQLANQQYLHNQLIHAPNPKLLLPLSSKRSFAPLTQEILLKLNKVDMVALKYWSMFEYEPSDVYEKVRKAQGWEFKVEVLLLGIKQKLSEGLLKYMNLVNEVILRYGYKELTEDVINQLTSYTEILLEICRKHSEPHAEEIALEKVDIGLVFEYNNIIKNPRQKEFLLKLFEVYLRLIIACKKPKIKLRTIKDIAVNIYKIIKQDKDEKLTRELSILLDQTFSSFSPDEKQEFFIEIVREVNLQWVKEQRASLTLVRIEYNVLSLLAHLITKYDIAYFNKNKLTILEFLLILAFNQDEKSYYDVKSAFCYLKVELSYSLAGSNVFNLLQQPPNPVLNMFRKRLQQKYGFYNFERFEYEGLLGIIDEMVIFRITGFMERVASGLPLKDSYFAVLVQFIEETEKLSGDINNLVMKYFNTCVRTYMLQLKKAKRTDEHKDKVRQVIKQDISYLIQSSASAHPLVTNFSRTCLNMFVEEIPEIAFHTQLLKIFSEVISFLYIKVSQEYESKSEALKGRHLLANILIPNNISEIMERLGKIMVSLYQVVLRGHCIDDTYLKLRVSYLIREENTFSTELTFGYKFLRHLINNFREDRDFIEREVLMGNACLWWINEGQFNQRIKSLKPDQFILDKSLIPLHKCSCDSSILKNIVASVKPQIETEYLIVPPQSGENEIIGIINELNYHASELQKITLFENEEEHTKQDIITKMFRSVGRVKMLNLEPNKRLELLSRLLDVCKRWSNPDLLQYILSKIVPFLYCVGRFDTYILSVIAETHHYLTIQLNRYSKLDPIQRVSEQDIFSLKLDFLFAIEHYEEQEMSPKYGKYLDHLKTCRNFPILHQKIPSCRPIAIKGYQQRFNNLKKMHSSMITILSHHNQVTLAKGIKLSLINTILSENIKLKKGVLEFLPLETICQALKTQLEFVNVLKALIEKDGPVYDIADVNYFYYKTLKMGLYHFQRQTTFYHEELLVRSGQIDDLSNQIKTFIQVCNHLRNEDLHKITNNKVKAKKDDIFSRHKKALTDKVERLKRNERAFTENENLGSTRRRKDEPEEVTVELPIFRFMLLYLISQHIDRAKAFSYCQLGNIHNPYSLRGKKKFIKNQEVLQLLQYLGNKSLVLIYNIACTFNHCLQNPQAILREIGKRVTTNIKYNFAEFLPLYIEENKDDELRLREINYWSVPHIQILLKYLTEQYEQKPYLQLYVTKILARLYSQQLLFYLPQMNQALSLRSGKLIFRFFLDYSERSTLFAHQVIWISKVEAKQEVDPHNKTKRSKEMEEHLQSLRSRSVELIDMTIRNMDAEKKSFFNLVNDFFERVTAISGTLDPKMPTDNKRTLIQEQLQQIQVTPDIYLPTNPRYQVDAIKLDSGIPMQSAAKCPILVTFYCNKYGGPDEFFQRKMQQKKHIKFQQLHLDLQDQHQPLKIPETLSTFKNSRSNLSRVKPINIDDISLDFITDKSSKSVKSIEPSSSINMTKRFSASPEVSLRLKEERTQVSCIFKVFDDIRQDSLALQIIRLFLQIFQKNNLDLYLFPYKTISNRTGKNLNIGGIIECVPNTISRDGIGKVNRESLYEYFINKFGPQHNINFQQARDNFIKSQAAYSLISYFLQIKDRHNGNILISNEGYIIHIDFGFIFDISPANNLKFESANFKLTREMIDIMGRDIKSEPFQSYMNLMIRAFLVVRKYHEHVYNTIRLMSLSGLPCFLPQTMENMRKRFVLEYNDSEAADYMRDIILDAADKWSTNWYDRIQWMQQKIYH